MFAAANESLNQREKRQTCQKLLITMRKTKAILKLRKLKRNEIDAPMSRALTCNDNFSTHVEGPDHRSSPVVGIHGGNSGGEGLTREHLHDVLTSKVVPTQQI